MQIVEFVFGTVLVLVVATSAWLAWSARRELPGRSHRGKSSPRTIDDHALGAKLTASIWTRLAELKESGIQLALRSRLEATAGAPVAERLLVLQEVLLDLESLEPGRALLADLGSARSVGGTPSDEVLELLRLPPDQRSGFIGRAIVAGIEPLLASSMGPRNAEAFLGAMGSLPDSVDEWSKWIEEGFLADLFARMLERSKSGIGPEALLKILEQSASAVGAKFPLPCFPAILTTFPEGLLEREKIACAARETLWQELSAKTAGDAVKRAGFPDPRQQHPLLTIERLQAALADRYRLERELGRGGMATVYLAQDLRHERPVAFKMLHPELAEPLGAERRFLREIRTAARLEHPHILTVLDSGDVEGQLWYTMPFVEGESLRDRLRRDGLLPIPDAVRLAGEVADALAYAHGHGIVHRDIKPENILLSGGHARVADFGIARALEVVGSDTFTGSGVVVGTPAYMSPEQASGEGAVDGRSDVYSLGCVVYEMLAGKPLWSGPSPLAVLAKRFSESPRPLRLVRKELPEYLEQAVTRALALEPAERFQSATEFAQALAGESVVPVPGSAAPTPATPS